MKTIELEDDLYRYIASQTQDIGESASDILRRLLSLPESCEVELSEVEEFQRDITDENRAKIDPAPVRAPVAPAAVSKPMLPSKIDQLIESKKFKETKVSVRKFIQILTVLYNENPKGFIAATEIKGRKRIYFATSKNALLNAGSTTKPRQIDNTPYWVITNTNTGRKRNIIAQLMAEMGYPHALIEAVSNSI